MMHLSIHTYRSPAFTKNDSVISLRRNGKVDMVLFPGGYATLSNGNATGAPTFHYYTTDYLGNVRAVTNGSTGALEQAVSYYPYGGVIPGLSSAPDKQPYKFGGKELTTTNGLNEYDFGARQYWQAVPGFTSIDPCAGNYTWLSPYIYCGNNPVNLVDPDGKETKLYATRIPGAFNKISYPTHTFITISRPGEKLKYYAYCPSGFLMGKLSKAIYAQDISIYKHPKENEDLIKSVITISPPDGMTQEDFDNKVIETAESFGNLDGIEYNILTNSEDTGNCNTSTYTILYKAGVTLENLVTIAEQIPENKHGFGQIRPWTEEEQQAALDKKKEQQENWIRMLIHLTKFLGK